MAATKPPQLYQFDKKYLQALCHRDSATENHFVCYFTPLLQAWLRRRLRNDEQVREALQETFCRVFTAVRSSGCVRHPERFGAFVFAVCSNVTLESYRQQKRYLRLQELESEPVDTIGGPDAAAAAGEERTHLFRVLARLPQKDRELLTAIFLREWDKDDVCRRMGISRAHLRVLLHRAKQKFQLQARRRPFVHNMVTGFRKRILAS